MDRRVEGIIMLSQLLVVAVVEVGGELGNYLHTMKQILHDIGYQ